LQKNCEHGAKKHKKTDEERAIEALGPRDEAAFKIIPIPSENNIQHYIITPEWGEMAFNRVVLNNWLKGREELADTHFALPTVSVSTSDKEQHAIIISTDPNVNAVLGYVVREEQGRMTVSQPSREYTRTF
jgi:hypothetical protein